MADHPADPTRSTRTVRGAARGCVPTVVLAGVVAGALLGGSALADDASPDAANAEAYDVDPVTGYRAERYRAPVPDSVPGGITLDTAAARTLHDAGDAIFIDVFPPSGLGADPLDGHWIVSEPHDTIPGATWLPEVGRGFLEAGHQDYLERNLERLTGGDATHPLVFFCTADCWQSWNAARRTARLGHTAVHWFPLGTDGWRDAGLALERARPVNFLDDTLPAGDDPNP